MDSGSTADARLGRRTLRARSHASRAQYPANNSTAAQITTRTIAPSSFDHAAEPVIDRIVDGRAFGKLHGYVRVIP